jgi:signal transduction histidine kinase/CheY-like chemotaxis protein
MTILLVDDHQENLYLLESLLKAAGYTVRMAANGVEALEILQAGGIDLIVSDILMPVMDGFQLCRKIKTDESLRAIPLIIYTATYTGPQDEEFAMKIGVDRFLVKPCEPEVFMAAVNEVLAASRSGKGAPSNPPIQEEEALKLYSERLVRKLEQKVLEADRELQARQEAEKALRESEAKYHAMVENVDIGVTLIGPDLKIVEMNRKMREWFPTLRSSDGPVYHGVFGDPARKTPCQGCPTCRTLQNGEVHEATAEVSKDGKIRNYRMVSSPVRNAQGELIAAIEMVEDITEHLRLAAQFQHAQKMESVGRLAGGVAHDFNNMLSVILGYAELALSKITPDDPLHADLMEISNAAKRSTEITRQLLAFARKQTINPRVLDLNETVEGMLKILRRLIGEDIDLVWKPGSGLGPVKMDPAQIDQILANLCVNARDAIAGVGQVTIETQGVAFDESDCSNRHGFLPGKFILLAISDNGCGMDKEILDHIFEPFFTTKEVGQGTGLGLATVYGIVNQNNGFIDISSEPGKGTTFRIYLPLYEGGAGKVLVETVTEVPTRQGETVLLVEDEPAIEKMGRRMLENLGYRVLSAGSPSEAMRLADEHGGGIHLLIADVVMPGMNGRDLADRLHSLYPNIKTLFMSGYTADVIARQGVLEEGVRFIQKPFSVRELSAKVREILNEE